MRLTKQTSHAIRILIDCANAGDVLVKSAEISSRLGITLQNTFKIMHLLSRAGFVAATRGPKGGVRLARPAKDIRIGDVVRAMEATTVEIEDTDLPPSRGSKGGPQINAIFDDALEAFISVLDQHTLEDMARLRRGGSGAPKQGRGGPAVKKPRTRSVSASAARGEAFLRRGS
jgi:Rrf2 family protein